MQEKIGKFSAVYERLEVML